MRWELDWRRCFPEMCADWSALDTLENDCAEFRRVVDHVENVRNADQSFVGFVLESNVTEASLSFKVRVVWVRFFAYVAAWQTEGDGTDAG